MRSRRARAAILVPTLLVAAYLVAYAVAAALHPGHRPGWAPASAMHALQVAATALAVLAVRRQGSSRDRRGLALIAAGMASYTIGDYVWGAFDNPLLSVADPLFLAFPPLTAAGLMVLLAPALRAAKADAWLDGLATALGAAALGALLVSGPVLSDALSAQGTALLVNAAYPLGDLVLVALVLCAFVVTGARLERRFVLLTVGILAFWVTDSLYLRASTEGTYTAFSWYEPGWAVALFALAAAGFAPPSRLIQTDMAWSRRAALTNAFATLAILMLAAPAVTRRHNDDGLLSVLLAVGCLAAVLLQQARTLRDHDAARRKSDSAARTDALTGLGNRRALSEALAARAEHLHADRPQTLALFDLDGFKSYNDAFGHAAGDALLRRMGESLRQTLAGVAEVFRMGGDEFCVLVPWEVDRPDVVVRTAAAAMVEEGEGFTITASHGAVTMPQEAAVPEEALRIADHRMFACKRRGRASAGRQTSDVLLQALAERDGDLSGHNDNVADLSGRVARQLGLSPDAVEETVLAARLHDVGKVAIPDAVLQKPAPLDAEELDFIRRHTLIGERILQAAPALTRVAKIVRSTHERWDGEGYPDALAGEAIPLSARIVFVCAAFDAMSTHRPYQPARAQPESLAELTAHAGTQFDARVVQALATVLEHRGAAGITALQVA